MKERPFIFRDWQVQALLAGRLKQLRVPVVPQPWCPVVQAEVDEEGYIIWKGRDTHLRKGGRRGPFGKTGDRLWVRETWCEVDERENGELWFDYRATPQDGCPEAPAGWHAVPPAERLLHWCPSTTMPRRASRFTLEVLDLRVQQLDSVIYQDLIDEGHQPDTVDSGAQNPAGEWIPALDYLGPFVEYWQKRYARKGLGWYTKPWCWLAKVTPTKGKSDDTT